MRPRPGQAFLRLALGDLLCIIDGCGMQVSVEEGRLLATQEGDPNDTLVTAEAPFWLSQQGKTILAACCDALVRLEGRAAGVQLKRYHGPTPVVLYELPG